MCIFAIHLAYLNYLLRLSKVKVKGLEQFTEQIICEHYHLRFISLTFTSQYEKSDYDIVFTQLKYFACLLSIVNKHNLYVDIDRQLSTMFTIQSLRTYFLCQSKNIFLAEGLIGLTWTMELLNTVPKFVKVLLLFVLIVRSDAQGKGRGISKRTWASAK